MADTERTLAELLNTLFRDGQTRGISAQDVRDLVVSLTPPRGSLYVADGDQAETVISDVNTWTEVAGVTTAGPSETARQVDMPADGHLRYTGPVVRDFEVTALATVIAASNNVDLEFALAVNGVVQEHTEVNQRFGQQNENEMVTVSGLLQLEQDDVVQLMAQNVTDASNLTAQTMALRAFGFLT